MMQLELAPEIEALLTSEARQRGISPGELVTEMVGSSTSESRFSVPSMTEEERHAVIDRHIAWMKETTPDWETRDPYAVDWQAIKAEGRKY